MPMLQLHYTSSRMGESGRAGFGIRAHSEGLQEDEKRELVQLGSYRPPLDANPEPSAEEIRDHFPRAFRFFTLSSGRWAMLLSSYAGRDYSGRWGNYFSHVLVGDEPPLRWPIDYYDWAHWKTGLAADEDTAELPPPLPPVELGLREAEAFSLARLQAFLGEAPGRAEHLTAMLRAVLHHGETSRPVLIRDTARNGLYWTACIQKAFPLAHQRGLSFSTYQYESRTRALVNATSGETDFAFGDSERAYQFYVFDFHTGLHSPPPEADEDDYAAAAAGWMAADPVRMAAFLEFVNRFTHESLEPGLAHAVTLFELWQGGPPRLSGERRRGALEFARGYTAAADRGDLMELLAAILELLLADAPPEDQEAVARLAAEGAAATGDAAHRRLAYATWLGLFDDCVLRGQGGAEAVRRLRRELNGILPGHEAEGAAQFLAPEHQERLRGEAARTDPAALALVLETAVEAARLLGRVAWDEPVVRGAAVAGALAAARRGEAVDPFLHSFRDAPGALAELCLLGGKQLQAQDEGPALRALGQGVARALAARPEAERDALRRRLAEAQAWEVLLGEWEGLLEREDDRPAAYDRYRRTVVDVLPGFREARGAAVAEALLERLPPARAGGLAAEWLTARDAGALPAGLGRRLLERANAAVPLDPEARGWSDEVLQALVRLADPAALSPNRLRLRQAMQRALDPGAALDELELHALPAALAGVGADDYRAFTTHFLPHALRRTHDRQEYRSVLQAVWLPEHARGLAAACREAAGQEPARLERALAFWLPSRSQAKLGVLRGEVLEGLAAALRTLSARDAGLLAEDLKKSRELSGAERAEGQELLARARSRSPLGLVRGLLGRLRAGRPDT
jgi:hypothetical protein